MDLIERLEKATGPDHELDCAIEGIHPCASADTPFYTSSIDAAMTLVPDDWWLTLDRYVLTDQPGPQPYLWRAWLKRLEGDFDNDDAPLGLNKQFAHGPSIPLTLCIVALRVRAALKTAE